MHIMEMSEVDNFMNNPHGNQNYFKPREQLVKKEALIGPVTAVALPSSVHDDASFSLVARGSWVELTIHGSKKEIQQRKYRKLIMTGHEGGTIHGMTRCLRSDGDEQSDIWVFHGGRYLAFACINVDPVLSQICPDGCNPFTLLSLKKNDSHQMSDWVWDVRALEFPDASSVSTDFDYRLLVAVGLAHNTVEIWSFGSCCNYTDRKRRLSPGCLRKIKCDTRCITYSLSFFGWKIGDTLENTPGNSSKDEMDLAVVVGTVSNEVLLWNVIEEGEGAGVISHLPHEKPKIRQKKVLHRLVGHQGVVYSVKFGAGAKYIVSTSDDRTVRLWEKITEGDAAFSNADECTGQTRMLKHCKYQSKWIGYGHTARIWGADFILLPDRKGSSSKCDGVATVGEDSTVKLWRIDDGREVATLKGHGSKSVWKVSSNRFRDKIITGGNDGVAKIWDITYHIINNGHTRADEHKGGDEDTQQALFSRLIVPPDDEGLLPTTEKIEIHENISMKTSLRDVQSRKSSHKTKSPPAHRQIICGICFYPNSQANMLIATRSGMLMTIHLSTGKWLKHSPWTMPMSRQNGINTKPLIGSCMAMHPKYMSVAVGTSNGKILLTTIENSGKQEKVEFGAIEYPAIQSLHWLDGKNLIAFHIKGISVWWRFATDLGIRLYQPNLKTVLSMGRKGIAVGIPVCYHYDRHQGEIFIGDSRGNIGAFVIDDEILEGAERVAVDILCYTHKKEHVTDIIPTFDGNGLLSVGNDGFIHETAILRDDDGVCIKLSSVIRRPVSCLTGIQHIFRAKLNGNKESIIVGGYHGNKFIVWDASVGYQLLSLDTGGRNRHLELSIQFQKDAYLTRQNVVICVANKKGPNELLFHSNAGSTVDPDSKPLGRISLGSPCHGETIFDVAFCATRTKNKMLFLSGSNDCTVKLHQVVNHEISLVTELPPHESCIRAICCSQEIGSNSSLLIVSGGKLISSFYRLDEIIDGSFKVTFLCNSQLPDLPTIDQRMNAVCAIPLNANKSESTSHLVLSGDSDGCIHFTEVSELIGQPRKVISKKLSQDDRPILCIDLKRISKQHIIACIGNTRGEVAVWLLPGWSEIKHSDLPRAPIYVYREHQIGTNCLSLIELDSDSPNTNINLAIASGGDDQTISICLATIELAGSSNQSITFEKISSVVVKESCASAIKGIKLLRDSTAGLRLYAAGYDQRISMWSLDTCSKDEPKSLRFVSSCSVDIKDVNALDLCTIKGPNGEQIDHLLAAGEGLDICSVNACIWKAAHVLNKCDFLLITVGAGFSSDSGLPTYEKMPEEYRHFCNPMSLRDQPIPFQKFWTRSSQMYTKAKPHKGYEILADWCGGGKLKNLAVTKSKQKETSETSPWWIYSSNVDGLFNNFPCFSNTICEIHGRATEFRCSRAIGYCDGVQRCGEKWKSWNQEVESSPGSIECANSTFAIETTCKETGIKCQHCSVPARPNVLMFHDTDENVLSPIDKNRERYQRWEALLENEVATNGANAVILELGAGNNVPAVRSESEEVLRDCVDRLKKSRSKGSITCIRINPRDAGFDEIDSQNVLSIYEKAEYALKMIDYVLTSQPC